MAPWTYTDYTFTFFVYLQSRCASEPWEKIMVSQSSYSQVA